MASKSHRSVPFSNRTQTGVLSFCISATLELALPALVLNMVTLCPVLGGSQEQDELSKFLFLNNM